MSLFRKRNYNFAEIISIISLVTILCLSLTTQPSLSQQPECENITYSFFSDSSDERTVEFLGGLSSNISSKMVLPKGADVVQALAHLVGSPKVLSEDQPIDVVLVNDVSLSMQYNCYCADGTPSLNGYCTPSQGYPYHPDYPCKIEDMKNASKIFSNAVLAVENNTEGLVSYASNVKSFLGLTNNISAVEEEIDGYTAGGSTCISCGIAKAVDLLASGTNDAQFIVLMSDGEANYCIPGYNCEPDSLAKQEAIDEAADAFSTHGIKVFTIAFGAGADNATMMAIANASGGQYFFAGETDIEDVYLAIAAVITSTYPTNPFLDVGSDGNQEWNWSGSFETEDDADDYSASLEALLADCNCTGCVDPVSDCTVDFNLTSETAGFISINTTVVIEVCIECDEDSDCDDNLYCNGQETCNMTSNTCVPGTPPDCDDAVNCTQDSCNETTDSCDNIPDDSFCDNSQYCDGEETCDPFLDCQPGTPIDCSGFNLSEISTCDNDPDNYTYTWDYAAGFTSVCNETTDSCTQGSYTFTHECRDNDPGDGINGNMCGAECDQDSDCPCPPDGCVGDDWYDYPDNISCIDCFCETCVPNVTINDSRCITICERDGKFGQGHQYLCKGDGTYFECNENGTGYEHVNICLEACTASPECEGQAPMTYLMSCDLFGHDYLQDYCDDQCQIVDNNCEDDWQGCTSEPECDEQIPGTDNCTYECEYKPEICYIDGIWGDRPHQYVCREDNTYWECVESGPGYGTHYEHVNVCSYLCTGSLECDGVPPGTDLPSCDAFGETYLQDYCNETCHVQDDDCEYGNQGETGCTAYIQCDEASPTADLLDDSCDEMCVYHFCGDDLVDTILGEQCDPPGSDSSWCNQTTEECESGTNRKGIRDEFGDCSGGCTCLPDPFIYQCVEGECGADCDEDSDCENFCSAGNILNYNGQCDLAMDCDCSWSTEDCDDYDDDFFVDFHCYVPEGDIYDWYEDWWCTENGEAECADSETDWPKDLREDCVDDCSDTDGGIHYNISGTATDRELCDDESETVCPQQQFTDFCSNDILTEYYCDGADATFTTFNCSEYDFHDEYEFYCDGDDIRKKRLFHDFSCSQGGCTENTYYTDDQLVEDCNLQDDWYNFGNVGGLDDPECEFRDYTCVENLEAHCDYNVNESHDYDNLDGSYCIDNDEGVEDRDYYCDSSGQSQYVASNQQDCGQEGWSGGGNTDEFNDDPSCIYGDYFCVDDGVNDYCDSSTAYTEDFDNQDATECDGPGLIGDHDYWCDLPTCDDVTPSNGCSPGDNWYNLSCDQTCNAECDGDEDCPPNSCSVTYDDYCQQGGHRLFEYDSDKALDSTTVMDSCENTCDTSITSCSCSDCPVDCSAPSINDYCVLGVCTATCELDSDCPPYINGNDYCHYDRSCQYTCDCTDGSLEFCPPAGTVHEGTCYYGSRDCINVEGCTLDTCVLEPEQMCDPRDGCIDVGCVDITPITLFHDGTSEKVIEYPSKGGSNVSAKVRVPKALVVSSGTVNLTGLAVSFTEDRILDFVLVNDVSGSMDDNCYCADGTPSNNGFCTVSQGYPYHPDFPCKIEDLKNASKVFSDAVLAVAGNMIGLVSYSSKLKSSVGLTNNSVVIVTEINSYSASGATCISCGIREGIDIVNSGSNIPIIILMTDGNANRCFAGVACGEVNAKAQALSEAQRAWDDYGISIVTVGFGDDADVALLQQIADVSGDEGGLGSFHFANVTDLEDLYEQLATLLTMIFPTNPSLDTGSDSSVEWSFMGEFMISQTANFTEGLQDVLDCTCDGCQEDGDFCIVDLNLSSDTAGILIANNLLITGCIPEIPQDIECYNCSNCGGGPDCQDFGAWSAWDCTYSDVCDESGDCSRSRSVTTYVCMNAGTESSFCDSSGSAENQYDTSSRDTDGNSCDDGLWCTVNDQCTDEVCSGTQRDCDDQNPETEDSCDEDADQCVHAMNSSGDDDSDGDGINDTEDACPEIHGLDCNGCPDPCVICAYMVCPQTGPPTCAGNNSACPLTYCPFDGCGQDCESYEWADYPDSLEGICDVVGGEFGVCQPANCSDYVTCTPDERCGWEPECYPADHILITEVLYDAPETDNYGEWVELYNPTDSNVDLTEWRLFDNSGAYWFSEGAVIKAGEFLSLAHYDNETYYSYYGCYPDIDDFSRPLNDDGDFLRLVDNTATDVDFVAWEGGYSGSNPEWNIYASENKTIQRDPPYCDTDSPSDWLNDTEATPTCSQESEYCLLIQQVQVLDSEFNPQTEIEPGDFYNIRVTTENTCEEEIEVLQIVQIDNSSNIELGTVKYEIGSLETVNTTLGFNLPEVTFNGTQINVTVFNWNHWPSENLTTFKALSEPGFTSFLAVLGGT
jgi:Mg-chelatase subunit ChlD